MDSTAATDEEAFLGQSSQKQEEKKPRRQRCKVASPCFFLQPGALPLVLPVELTWGAEVWLAESGPKHHKSEFKNGGALLRDNPLITGRPG